MSELNRILNRPLRRSVPVSPLPTSRVREVQQAPASSIDLSTLSPLMAKARVLSMTRAEIRRLSPDDMRFAQEILQRRETGLLGLDNVKTGQALDRMAREARTKRIDYDSNLPLTTNIGNFTSNFVEGSADILSGIAELLTPEGAMAAGSAIGTIYRGGSELIFDKAREWGGGVDRRSAAMKAEAERAKEATRAVGRHIQEGVESAWEDPLGAAFRNPAEIGTALVPWLRAAGVAKLGPAASAGLAVAEAPISALRLGKRAITKGAELTGSGLQQAGKALSGVSAETQALARSQAFTGEGRRGLLDALRKTGDERVPLGPADTPMRMGEGAGFHDDMIRSIIETKGQLKSEFLTARTRFRQLRRDFRQQNKNPNKRIGEGEPIVTQESVVQAEVAMNRYKELDRLYAQQFPTKTPKQRLDIPRKLQNSIDSGNEYLLQKMQEAEDITKISVLPRATGFSMASPSTASLAGQSVRIEAMRQPLNIAIAAGVGTVAFNPAMLGLLAAIPFTNPRNILRILIANGWTREQAAKVADLTAKVTKIPGVADLTKRGITYGGLFQIAGLSQEELIRGNN